jgi:hypothetical protein
MRLQAVTDFKSELHVHHRQLCRVCAQWLDHELRGNYEILAMVSLGSTMRV